MALLLVSSCTGELLAPHEQGVAGNLEEQRARWAQLGIRDYDFSVSAWSEWGSGAYDIEVRGGVAVKQIRQSDGQASVPDPRSNIATIDSLFALTARAITRDGNVTVSRFQPSFHFILYGSWDHPDWADDSFRFHITRFRSR